jgi:hypothetical protein
MRRIMLTFALMLWASQVEASLLFTPDFFTLDVRAVFNETGTNSFCWQCDDADPLNDFQAVLDVQNLSESWTDFLGWTAGESRMQGTATNYLGLDAEFALKVKMTAAGASLPESLTSPSVSFGFIRGRLLGVDLGDVTALILECCNGRVGGIQFQQAFFPSDPFIIPPGELERRQLNLELHFPEQIEYTPIPEPMSLLLLGSGLAAAALTRRRSRTR